MTSIPNSLTFLESVTGYAQQIAVGENPSANAPIRLAVIDPGYVANTYPTTLPRVTFEGEETVTDKRYVVIDRSYRPGPSDRVVMLPVGHTYVIAGVVTPATTPPIYAEAYGANTSQTTTSTSYTSTLSTGTSPTAGISLAVGQYVELHWGAMLSVATVGVNGAAMSWQLTGASGTVDGGDTAMVEAGSDEWTPAERCTVWGPATGAGTHTLGLRYKAIGTATAQYKLQHVLIKVL